MLIRRSALAYIGLYNTSFTMMDWEYALRISYLKANIAYYTGYNALSVSHAETVSALKSLKDINEQGKRAAIFYEYAGDGAEISTWSKVKISLGKILLKRKSDFPKKSMNNDFRAIYQLLQNKLDAINQEQDGEFIS